VLRDRAFVEALLGIYAPTLPAQGRLPLLLEQLRAISEIEDVEVPERFRNFRCRLLSTLYTPHPDYRFNVSLQSTNLSEAWYVPESLELHIVFHGGREYLYSAVPLNVYAGLIRAASHGQILSPMDQDEAIPYRRVLGDRWGRQRQRTFTSVSAGGSQPERFRVFG